MLKPVIAVLLALAYVTGVPGGADARWTGTPPALSAPGANAVDPVTAVGPGGVVALVWRRKDDAGYWRVQIRVLENGWLGPTQTLSRAGHDAFAPDVAVDATGRIVVVWSQRDSSTGGYTVMARSRTGGVLSTFRFLSAGVGDVLALRGPEPQLELDPTGTAVVAWQAPFAEAYRVVARAMAPDDVVSPTWQTLSRAGVVPGPIALSVADDGGATLSWARDTGTDTRIESRTRTAAGSLGVLRVLSPAGVDSVTPAVAVTPAGDAVVAWVRDDTAGGTLYARLVSAAGVPGPLRKVSASGKDVAGDPATGWGDVAVTDSGDAVIVWQQDKPDANREVAVRGLSSASTLSPLSLVGSTGHAYQPQVVILPSGEALLAFTQRDDYFWDRIVVRTRASDGALGDVETLSPFGHDARLPDLAVNDAGRAAAIWVGEDGSFEPVCCDRVQFAVGP